MARRATAKTKLGRQPFQIVLQRQGRTLAWLAREIDTPYPHVFGVASGRVPPTREFRRRVAKVARRPVRDLFTEAALVARYDVRVDSVAPLGVDDRPSK